MSKSLLSLTGQADPEELVPTGWSSSHLSSICQIFGGGRMGLTKEEHYQSSGILAYSAAGPDGFVEQAEIEGKDGVVLSAIGARCGRCFLATGAWTTLANVQAIIPGDALDAKYLFYYVNRDGYWERSGSAQPFIKPSSIKSSWVVFPPSKPEQTKIAEILSTVDRAIEQTEALIAKQQRLKTGLMQDLLTRGIDEHGNLRSEQTHPFKDSSLGRIPVEWECLRLEQMTRVDSPITYGVVQPGKEDENGVRFLRGGDVYGGEIHQEKLRTISRTVSSSYKRTVLEGGELVMSLVGYPGEVAVIPPNLAGSNLARQVALIRLAVEYDANYVMYYLMSVPGKRQVFGSTLGSAQQVVNLKDLRNVLIPLPKPKEQAMIRQKIDGSFLEFKAQTRSLAKLRSLKTALMQDLLTGRKRVKALLDGKESCA
jgi:type I restriction enzyme S subunit